MVIRFRGGGIAARRPDQQAHHLILAFLIWHRLGRHSARSHVPSHRGSSADRSAGAAFRILDRSFQHPLEPRCPSFSEAREATAQTRKTDHRVSNFHSGEFDPRPMLRASWKSLR
jgi:hypothetical protein